MNAAASASLRALLNCATKPAISDCATVWTTHLAVVSAPHRTRVPGRSARDASSRRLYVTSAR